MTVDLLSTGSPVTIGPTSVQQGSSTVNYRDNASTYWFNGTGADTGYTITNTPAGPLTLNTGDGNDSVSLQRTSPAPTTIRLGAGTSTVRVSNSTSGAGVVTSVLGLVTVTSPIGTVTLTVDNSGSSTARTASLDDHRLTGLGLVQGIVFANQSNLNLNLGTGGDTIQIRNTDRFLTTTVVAAGTGTNTINLGGLAPTMSGGTVGGILGKVVVQGNGSDSLTLDDSGNSGSPAVVLTSTQLTGLGLGTGIAYSHLANLNVLLGSGTNVVAIRTTAGDTSTTFATPLPVAQVSGKTYVVGSLAPGLSGGNLQGLAGPLVLNGVGVDVLQVDNRGDSATRTGRLTSTTVTGFGMSGSGITYTQMAFLTLGLGTGGTQLGIASTQGSTRTTVKGIPSGTSANTIVVGSLAPSSTGGNVQGTAGLLTVTGTGIDSLTLDDSGDSTARSATIAGSTITGLGMGSPGIVYSGLAQLLIKLGTGGDTVAVRGTASGTTVTVQAALSGSVANTFAVGSLAPNLSGGLLQGIAGPLVVNGTGRDVLTIDDTGNTTVRAGTLGSDRLTGQGMGSSGISFSGLSSLTLQLRENGNTLSIPTTRNGVATTIQMVGPLGAPNTVIVGSLAPSSSGGNVQGIIGPLTIVGTGNDRLIVDDSGDATARSVTITRTSITGLGMGSSGITSSGLVQLVVRLGTGGVTAAIVSTPSVTQTVLQAASSGSAANAILVGSLAPTQSGGTAQGVAGPLTVTGGGSDTLLIDDSGDPTARTVTLTSTKVAGLTLGSGGIAYSGLAQLKISLGTAANAVAIASTAAGTTSTVQAAASGGANTIAVGGLSVTASGGNVLAIAGGLVVNGLGRDILTVDNSGDANARSMTLSGTSLKGLGMGAAGLAYSGLSRLNVNLGQGADTVAVQGTSAGTTTIQAIAASSMGKTFVVGSQAPQRSGVLRPIKGALVLRGTGNAQIDLDDSGNSTAGSAVLTGSALTGLGMGASGIVLSGFSRLSLSLGTGGDTLAVPNTGPGMTTRIVSSGIGQAVNRIQVGSKAPIGLGGNLLGILGPLTVAGTSRDVLTVDGSGDSTARSAVLVGTSLSGMGMGASAAIAYSGLGSLIVNLGTGANLVSVRGTPGGSSVTIRSTSTGSKPNTIVVGSLAPILAGGNVQGILGGLTVIGSGQDTLNVDDAGDPSARAAVLTGMRLGGLGMGEAGITYSGLAQLKINLGKAADSFAVQGTAGGTVTTIQAGPSSTEPNAFLVGSLAPAASGGTVQAIAGALTWIGSGQDAITIDDSGDPTARTGTLTPSGLTGLAMGGSGISYSGVTRLTVKLGSGHPAAPGGVPGNSFIINDIGGSTQASVDGGSSDRDQVRVSFASDLAAAARLDLIGFETAVVTVNRDLAGTLTHTGGGTIQLAVGHAVGAAALIRASNISTMTVGPNQLAVGSNMAGQLIVDQKLNALRVAGGIPGPISVGPTTPSGSLAPAIGTVQVFGGFGPVVARIQENGITRRIDAASPATPYPVPNSAAIASPASPNFMFVYESMNQPSPVATIRVSAPSLAAVYDLALTVTSPSAKFNLARLDAVNSARVRNVTVEGDLLTTVSTAAQSFLADFTAAGISFPADNLAGVSVRDFVPAGSIRARSIQGVAFGRFLTPAGTLGPATVATAADAATLLGSGTVLSLANATFRVAFASSNTQPVAFFFVSASSGGRLDPNPVRFSFQSPQGTTVDTSRGSVTALIGITSGTIQTMDLRGDGGSIATAQWVGQAITSSGPLGDVTISSSRGITSITAPRLIGNITTTGPITGTIQTTGLATHPLTGITSRIAADIGRGTAAAPATIIQAQGLSGRIISRGSLISSVTINGAASGVIAAQQNLGSVTVTGALTGQVLALGDIQGNLMIGSGMSGPARIAAGGNLLGTTMISATFGPQAAIVARGGIGNPQTGTTLQVSNPQGILAAGGSIRFASGPPASGSVFNNARTTSPLDAAVVDALFQNASQQPLAFDLTSTLDLGGLSQILARLGRLTVNGGRLTV